MSLRRVGTSVLALAVLVLPVLAGCTGGSDVTAPELLAKAKKSLDDTKTAHFVLAGKGAPEDGTALVGGQGDIARPSSFQGTLKVLAAGSTVSLKVVSVDGSVYAQLPFAANYSVIDPAQFGFGDPGALLDPNSGISQLLAKAENAKLGDEKRVGGEVVREVTADLPGDLVEQVLTSQDPSKPVHARFSIVSDSGELRRAELTGPFFTADDDGTYTLELSDFGTHVSITPPPTS